MLFVPHEAPAWIRDPDVLWTEARAAERRRRGRYALTLSLDLPPCVSPCLLRALVEDFAHQEFTSLGRAVEARIRIAGRRPVARLHITTRRVTSCGITERAYPLPDAQQLVAWERAWNQLCARTLHPLLLSARARARRLADG